MAGNQVAYSMANFHRSQDSQGLFYNQNWHEQKSHFGTCILLHVILHQLLYLLAGVHQNSIVFMTHKSDGYSSKNNRVDQAYCTGLRDVIANQKTNQLTNYACTPHGLWQWHIWRKEIMGIKYTFSKYWLSKLC